MPTQALVAPYLRRGDSLYLFYMASTAPTNLSGYVEVLLPDGRHVQHVVRIESFTADRTLQSQSKTFEYEEGLVVDGGISGNTPLKRGQLYAFLVLSRQGLPDDTLCKGYVYNNNPVCFREYVESGPGGGEGFVRSIDLGDPAAGSDFADQAVPANAVWRVIGFNGALVTDVTAITRLLRILKTDGTDNVGLIGIATGTQPASLTRNYFGGDIGSTAGANATIAVTLDSKNQLPEGFVVDLTTENLVAGDNWGDGQLLVEEWLVV